MNRYYKKGIKCIFLLYILLASLHISQIFGTETLWIVTFEEEPVKGYLTQGTEVNISLKEDVEEKDVRIYINGQREDVIWENGVTNLYFGEEGKYKLLVENNDGYKSIYEFMIELDKPTTPKVATSQKKGKWTNKDITMSAYGSKCISGINHYEYRKMDEDWKRMKNGVYIWTKSMDEVIYVRGVSKAGKYSNVMEVPLKIWKKTPPQGKVYLTKGNDLGWYSKVPMIEARITIPEGPEVTSYYKVKNIDTGEAVTKKNNIPIIREDGRYQWTTWTTDEAGNQSKETKPIYAYVDQSKPEVSIDASKQTAVVTVKEENISKRRIGVQTSGDIIKWKRNGSVWNIMVRFQKEGRHHLKVTVIDYADNKTTGQMVEKIIDKTEPKITILGVKKFISYKKKVKPQVIVKDNFDKEPTTRILVNGKIWDGKSLEKDGLYRFHVSATDQWGNAASKSISFIVNQKGIQLKNLNTNWAGKTVKEDELNFRFVVEDIDPILVESFLVNDKPVAYQWKEKTLGLKYPIKRDGNFKVKLRLRDAANHIKEESFTISRDTTKPELLLKGVMNGASCQYGDKISVSIHNKQDQFVQVELDKKELKIKGQKVTLPKVNPGSHTLYVVAKDPVGNVLKKEIQFSVGKVMPKPMEKVVRKVQENVMGKSNKETKKSMLYIFVGITIFILGGIIKFRQTRL